MILVDIFNSDRYLFIRIFQIDGKALHKIASTHKFESVEFQTT